MNAPEIDKILHALADRLTERRWMLVTAESCTGGWVAKACTDLAGSSAWFERGYVTYSNRAKVDMLGVEPAVLELHGAVSEAVARQMADGALRMAGADVGVAVTGIAGPEGGTPEKPVGTVWFAWTRAGGPTVSEVRRFSGDREAVRRQAVAHALRGLLAVLAR